MAGIAFKLRRYTDEASYFGILKGYTYSAILVAGPWLVSAISLGVLAFFSKGEMEVFHSIIMYVICFSLIYVGIIQFVVTRFLADKLYSADIDLHIPTFVATLLITLVPQALVGGFFLGGLETTFALRLVAFSTYMAVNAVWVVLLFLGILRAYHWAVWAFIAGGCVSLIAGILLSQALPQLGALSGFLAGQVVTLAILIWLFLSEFPWKKTIDFSFLSYFRLYPALAVMGLMYYLSIWVDKFIYRASSLGELMTPPYLYAAPHYELSAFIAQLTIVPALAIFFLRVETDFYERYRDFFAAIARHKPLSMIESCKDALLDSVKKGFIAILQFQGTVTLTFVLLAPQIFSFLRLDPSNMEILRVLLLGSFFQTLLILTVILQLYFEFYRDALLSCIIFFLANAALTAGLLYFDNVTPGWGFTLSALGAFIFAARSFIEALKRLPEITFMRQLKPPALVSDSSSYYHKGGIALYHKELEKK